MLEFSPGHLGAWYACARRPHVAVGVALAVVLIKPVPALAQPREAADAETTAENKTGAESEGITDAETRAASETTPLAGESDDLVLARQIENPVSGIVRIPINNTVLFGLGPNNDVGNALVLAPIVPALFRNDWSLITRVILPIVVTVPDPAGSGNITGFGDMATDILGHKAIQGRKRQLYDLGLGPFIAFPTATNRALGVKRWRVGPEVIMGITARRVVTALFVRNLWTVDQRDGPDVNQLFLEYLFFYNLPKLWYLVTEPLITANWLTDRSDRWFVPLGGGVGKHFRVRRLPRLALTTRIQAFYNVVRTSRSPQWELNFRLVFWNPNPLRARATNLRAGVSARPEHSE